MSERETCNCGTNNLAHLHDCPTVLIPFLKNENDRLLAQVETLTRERDFLASPLAEGGRYWEKEANKARAERDAAIAAKEKAEADVASTEAALDRERRIAHGRLQERDALQARLAAMAALVRRYRTKGSSIELNAEADAALKATAGDKP